MPKNFKGSLQSIIRKRSLQIPAPNKYKIDEKYKIKAYFNKSPKFSIIESIAADKKKIPAPN